jgi:hypothetical protein
VIISVVVYSMDRQSFGTFPHIRKEVVKRCQPSTANFYSPPSVTWKLWMLRIGASLNHVAVRIVSAGSSATRRVSMNSIDRFSTFSVKTATRFCVAGFQRMISCHKRFATFTPTQAQRRSVSRFCDVNSGIGNDENSPESFTSNRSWFGHSLHRSRINTLSNKEMCGV